MSAEEKLIFAQSLIREAGARLRSRSLSELKIHLKNKSGYGTIKVSIQTFFVWQGGYYLDFFPRGTGWDTFFGKMLYILL